MIYTYRWLLSFALSVALILMSSVYIISPLIIKMRSLKYQEEALKQKIIAIKASHRSEVQLHQILPLSKRSFQILKENDIERIADVIKLFKKNHFTHLTIKRLITHLNDQESINLSITTSGHSQDLFALLSDLWYERMPLSILDFSFEMLTHHDALVITIQLALMKTIVSYGQFFSEKGLLNKSYFMPDHTSFCPPSGFYAS